MSASGGKVHLTDVFDRAPQELDRDAVTEGFPRVADAFESNDGKKKTLPAVATRRGESQAVPCS